MKIELKINGETTITSEVNEKETKKALKKKKRSWKPKSDKIYYFINECDKVIEEEAGKQVEKLKAIRRVKKYIAENFGVFEPDWENENQEKWDIAYRYSTQELFCDYSFDIKCYSPIGYLRTKKHAEQLIKDCKKDLELIYK